MGSEVAPEFVYDQGVYYSVAPDSYGFYHTAGNEKHGEWNGHHSFLGLNGQDIRHSCLQAESLPYVYYTPDYGYSPSYNPYNHYITGAVVDVDGTNLGVQPYFTNESYQQLTSSPAYIPVVPSNADIVPYSTSDPSLFGMVPSFAGSYDNQGLGFMNPLASSGFTNPLASSMKTSASMKVATENPSMEFPKFAQPVVNVQQRKQSWAGSEPQTVENAHLAGFLQTTSFTRGRVLPAQNSLTANFAAKSNYLNYGSMSPSIEKLNPRFPALSYGGHFRSPNLLNELNRGPRTTRAKVQGASIAAKSYTSKLNESSLYKNITVEPDHYDGKDFQQVDYPNAKFFVIKSYSEDDVHKSIKYNVWSSTPYGNKKLDSAYLDAQKLSGGEREKCPVFLFFSVNASGHFCGLAEMVGRVDFEHNMDFWQQDQWSGSFPIKWHIIKDVANSSLRHIVLENNEDRPVTHSRDTQEIAYTPGIAMLNIFKNSSLKESILDDFIYYEEMEKCKHQEKVKLPRRNYCSTDLIPTFVPANILGNRIIKPMPSNRLKPNSSPNQLTGDNMDKLNGDLSEANKKNQVGSHDQHLEVEMKPKPAFTELVNQNDRQLASEVELPVQIDRTQLNNKIIKSDLSVSQSLDVAAKLENCELSSPTKPDGPQLPDVAVHSSTSNMNKLSAAGYNRNVAERQVNRTVLKSQKALGKVYRPVQRHEVQPNCNGVYPTSETDQLKCMVPSTPVGGREGSTGFVLPSDSSEKRNDIVISAPNEEAKINNLMDAKCSATDAPKVKQGNPSGHAVLLPESQENANTDPSGDPLAQPKTIDRSSDSSSDSSALSDTLTIGSVQIKVKGLDVYSSGTSIIQKFQVDQGAAVEKKN